jgi:PII-like signaling protein
VSTRGGDAVKLGFHFGEHDRHRGRFLSEAVLELFEARELAAGVLLRGAEGFGAGQRLQTDRLLSLSEDLPLLALAADRRERIEPLAAAVAEIAGDGLLTLERARFAGPERRPEDEPHEEAKLTVYLGRRARRDGAPAHVAVVAALRRNGVAGATALVGVDGVAAGRRLRARFFGANSWVPALVVAVGERERIAAAVAELEQGETPPLATLEAIRVLRRDGRDLSAAASPLRRCFPPLFAEEERRREGKDAAEQRIRLTVYCSERSEFNRRSLYMELIRRLRAEGAAGATALRGVWGYHGDHAPHGDRLLALRRHVPIVTSIVDRAAACERWLEIIAELTAETGLVTAERVPAARISGPGGHLEGDLSLD